MQTKDKSSSLVKRGLMASLINFRFLGPFNVKMILWGLGPTDKKLWTKKVIIIRSLDHLLPVGFGSLAIFSLSLIYHTDWRWRLTIKSVRY